MDIGTQGPELHARPGVVNHTGMFEAPKVSLVGWTVIDTNSCLCPQLLKTRSKATATTRANSAEPVPVHEGLLDSSTRMNALSGERAI